MEESGDKDKSEDYSVSFRHDEINQRKILQLTTVNGEGGWRGRLLVFNDLSSHTLAW